MDVKIKKENLLKKIQNLYKQQNWQEMEQLCTQGLKSFPDSASTYYNRAIARTSLKCFEKAKEDLTKALKLRPSFQEAKLLLQKLDFSNEANQLSPSLLLEQESGHLKQLFQQKSEPIDKIGKYQIIEEIGRGGMGRVYKAYDPQMNKHIALKTMLCGIEEKELQRFIVEAKTMAKFNHANIVRVYDIGKSNGVPFIVMDFIEGQSLEQYLQNMPLNIRKYSLLMAKIGKAIQYAHNKNIIHRDLKPANIMLNENLEPYITDFGLAKEISSQDSLSKKGALIGTPQYMSPQQAQGLKIDHLSDIYALGAIYYKMLSRKTMIEGNNIAEIIFKVIHQEPTLLRKINSKLTKDLEIICHKAVAKKANIRYQSAQEFAEDIERFLHGKIIKARHASFLELSWRQIKKNKTAIFVSLLCVLLLFFGPSLLSAYHSRELEEQVNKYVKKAQKIIYRANKDFTASKRKRARLYSEASNEYEKALTLSPNLEKVKTKYFKLQEKIGNLAKRQKNYLLAYAIFKQCKKLGYAKADFC